jgi:hypothetical protein
MLRHIIAAQKRNSRHEEDAAADVVHQPVEAVVQALTGHRTAAQDLPVPPGDVFAAQVQRLRDLLEAQRPAQVLLVREYQQAGSSQFLHHECEVQW